MRTTTHEAGGRRWTLVTGVTVAVVAMLAVLAPRVAAETSGLQASSFTVVHAASFEGDAPGLSVPSGALLTVFTDADVTGESSHFPWVNRTPAGLTVSVSCNALNDMANVPVIYAGPSGAGTRINIYYPNADGEEPFGACAYSGPIRVRVRPAAGYGNAVERTIGVVAAHPGIFFQASTGTPTGDHRNGATAATTRLVDCVSRLTQGDPAACPIASGGNPAAMVLYLTGAEAFTCTSCGEAGIAFELAKVDAQGRPGPWLKQTLERLESSSTGVEKATVRVRTLGGAGAYRLRLTSTAPQPSSQVLTVGFGPAD